MPNDVNALLNMAVSETEAIKYSLHLDNHDDLSIRKGNKTPSDVFDQIYKAHQVVKRLIVLEGGNNERGRQ